MNLQRLYTILNECSCQLRKGPEIVEERTGNVHVTHVFAMPHESAARPEVEKVDMVFVKVGVDKQAAEKIKDELISILNEYPEPERIAGGPSYIEVGGIIGDQGMAFQLFAVGKVLGLWSVITPATLGITDEEQVKQLAGSGMIMMSGYKIPT